MQALVLLIVVTAVVAGMAIYTVACLAVGLVMTIGLWLLGCAARAADALAVRLGLVRSRS